MRLVHPRRSLWEPLLRAWLGWALAILTFTGCSDEPRVEPIDTTPPEAIRDLGVTDSSCATLSLSWTAPAEDGESGGAVSAYEIRYGTGDIGSIPWDSLTQVLDEPSPTSPGTRQSYVLHGLERGTVYSVAILSADDQFLRSEISNVARGRTRPEDCLPPGPISDLAVIDTTATSAILSWTAPAEDGFTGGRVASYDLRYTTGTLDTGSWSLADTVGEEPAPKDPGQEERFTMTGLSSGAVYQFGVRSFDESGNQSPISNVVIVRTPARPDTIPPDPIDDLAVTDIDPYHLRLTWTATGDDGRSGRAATYDLRMRIGDRFDESDWESAQQIDGEPTPGDPGTIETCDVGGLAPGVTFALSLQVIDREGNASILSNSAIATPPPPSHPLFADPRGICLDRFTGGVLVAEHTEEGGVLCGFSSMGERREVALIPHATGIREMPRGDWCAIGGEPGSAAGVIWRFDGMQSFPRVFHEGLQYPTALAVREDTVIVIEEGIPGVILYAGQGMRRALVTLTDGDPAGVAVDDRGIVYFGVNRVAGTSVIRRCTTGGGEAIDIHDLGPAGRIGDLILDETQSQLWYLDTTGGAVFRVSAGGGQRDTLAADLIHPVAIAPSLDPRFISYSSSDGYVLRALRRE